MPQVSRMMTLELAGKSGRANPDCKPDTVGDVGQLAPPDALHPTAEQFSPAAIGSVTMAPFAALGPLLVTIIE